MTRNVCLRALHYLGYLPNGVTRRLRNAFVLIHAATSVSAKGRSMLRRMDMTIDVSGAAGESGPQRPQRFCREVQ